MSLGPGFFVFMIGITLIPLAGWAIGAYRTRHHISIKRAYRKITVKILAVYYAAFLINITALYLSVWNLNKNVDILAYSNCIIVLAGPLVAGILVIVAEVYRLRVDRLHCRHCGYDLRHIHSAQCPECGEK